MDTEQLRQWIKERDEAILSFDADKYKAFLLKWKKTGVYKPFMSVSDRLIEISMYQSVLALAKATKEQKDKARAWLAENGYNEDPWGGDE